MNQQRNLFTQIFGLIILPASTLVTLDCYANDARVDYSGFVELSQEVMAYREERLVEFDAFNAMATSLDTIVLDTRSSAAFNLGHIRGAVNLTFADFTAEKLAAIIPTQDTRVLIYCNNNFTDNVSPVELKRVELALNVPTFINLYGYGYRNIYELGEAVSINSPKVSWVSADPLQQPVTTTIASSQLNGR